MRKETHQRKDGVKRGGRKEQLSRKEQVKKGRSK